MATFYITKYALSGGIVEAECEHREGSDYVRPTSDRSYTLLTIDKEAFTDPAAAVANAEARRTAKIASLKKQIAKLEKLDFAAMIKAPSHVG